MEKDKQTTTFELGLRVTAELIRSEEGEILKNEKKHYGRIKKEDIPIILKQFIKGKLEVEDSLTPEEKETLNFFISKVEKMLDFFTK